MHGLSETSLKDYLLIALVFDFFSFLSGSQQHPGESGNTHERSGGR